MIEIKGKIQPWEIREKSEHTLYVEGGDQSIDPKVLRNLLGNEIVVRALGSSPHIRSAAKALFKYYPKSYFLIDRDHWEEGHVEKSWANFPDPATHNLLIWRRKEIENYFLDPSYLARSKFCLSDVDEIGKKVLEFVDKRLFLDAANHVLISIRENMKDTGIQAFSNPREFPNKEAALSKLQETKEFHEFKERVERQTSAEYIALTLDEFLQKMTNGEDKANFGVGDWISMVRGKSILHQIINSSLFQVKDTDGNILSGPQKTHQVVKALLKTELQHQPDDFQQLRELIRNRVGLPL